MAVIKHGPDGVHPMHVCTVTFSEPDIPRLRSEILSSPKLTKTGKLRLNDVLNVIDSPKRYAFLRRFALRVGTGHPDRDTWLSTDAGLDPMQFTVVFPDKKGEKAGTIGERHRLFAKRLRDHWTTAWSLSKMLSAIGCAPTVEINAFFDSLFDRMVSISALSEKSFSWNALLDEALTAESLLDKEAVGCGSYSTQTAGFTYLEAGRLSACDRIARLAPLSIRRRWKEAGIEPEQPSSEAITIKLHTLCTGLPAWSVAEAIPAGFDGIRDLIRTARDRHWGPDTPDILRIIESARRICSARADEKIARWCSKEAFLRKPSEPEPADDPAPMVLARFAEQDLSAESLFW